jgi:cytochrome c5
MKTKQFLFLITVLLVLFFSGCKHESTVPLSNLAADSIRYKGIACNKDTTYFYNDVGPLIISSCAMAGCHDGNGGERGPLTTYNNIKKYVSVGNPGTSRLYTILSSSGEHQMPPPPRASFTSTQKLLVSNWIQQGALNNGCIDVNCDTTNVTYSGVVQIVMQTNCTGCHSATNASGGIKLDTYADLKSTITSGRFYGSIIQSSGFKPMPPGSKLTDCSIKKIKTWINNGSLNN